MPNYIITFEAFLFLSVYFFLGACVCVCVDFFIDLIIFLAFTDTEDPVWDCFIWGLWQPVES